MGTLGTTCAHELGVQAQPRKESHSRSVHWLGLSSLSGFLFVVCKIGIIIIGLPYRIAGRLR